jgi:uncharacterized protein (DUF2141 family)
MGRFARRFWSDDVKYLLRTASLVLAAASMAAGLPAAAQFRNKITNDPAKCRDGGSSAVKVEISGITPAHGVLRVQLYPGTAADWLKAGHWLNRIEIPARGSAATVCMPVPGPGTYAIAVRHDVNGNGKTDLRADGGGMSNNPAVSIFNLGKPSYQKTAFSVGSAVKTISIRMRYVL